MAESLSWISGFVTGEDIARYAPYEGGRDRPFETYQRRFDEAMREMESLPSPEDRKKYLLGLIMGACNESRLSIV